MLYRARFLGNTIIQPFAKVPGGSCQPQTTVASRNAEQAVSADAAPAGGEGTEVELLFFSEP